MQAAWMGHWLWGGGRYKYLLSGYVLLECNLTGLVCCSHISGMLVRLHFVRSLTLLSMGS